MATGERTFRASTLPPEEKREFDNTPVQPGTYELELRADKAKDVPSKTSGITYVKAPFVILGSGGDSAPDKWLWVNFILTTNPGSDGKTMQDRSGSVSRLVAATGEDPEFTLVTETHTSGEKIDILDPKAVVNWLQNHDRMRIKARLGVEPGTGGFGPKNNIKQFHPTTTTTGPE